jgi:hypothetical protein
MAYCHIDHQLNNYLAKEDRMARYKNKVEEVKAALLNGSFSNNSLENFSPLLPENINEAVGEMPDDLLILIRTSHPLIKEWIDNYWEKTAKAKAESVVDAREREALEPDYH